MAFTVRLNPDPEVGTPEFAQLVAALTAHRLICAALQTLGLPTHREAARTIAAIRGALVEVPAWCYCKDSKGA